MRLICKAADSRDFLQGMGPGLDQATRAFDAALLDIGMRRHAEGFAGARLGRHNHYGRVIAYTSEPGEDVIVFLLVEGVLEFLDDNGQSVGMETSHTFGARYEHHCAKTGTRPVDLTRFALT